MPTPLTIGWRLAATVALVGWMVAGPVLGQALQFNRPWLTAWHMYRTWGTGVHRVQFYERTPEGDVPVDRLAALGHHGWRDAGPDALIAKREKLFKQAARVCAARGPGTDLRADVDEGKLHGWVVVMRRERDLCR